MTLPACHQKQNWNSNGREFFQARLAQIFVMDFFATVFGLALPAKVDMHSDANYTPLCEGHVPPAKWIWFQCDLNDKSGIVPMRESANQSF